MIPNNFEFLEYFIDPEFSIKIKACQKTSWRVLRFGVKSLFSANYAFGAAERSKLKAERSKSEP